MSKSLADLDPWFRPYAEYLVQAARLLGTPHVTSTRRDYIEQSRLYMDYLSGKRSLPALPPTQSLHVYGLALDLVVGEYTPGGPPSPEMAALGAWWLQAGGRWGGKGDPVHFSAPVYLK